MHIEPGTVCMIRGVPQGQLGHQFNGNIVVAGGLKNTYSDGTRIRWIEPALNEGQRWFTGCREQWLRPFEDFDPEQLTTTDKELETA